MTIRFFFFQFFFLFFFLRLKLDFLAKKIPSKLGDFSNDFFLLKIKLDFFYWKVLSKCVFKFSQFFPNFFWKNLVKMKVVKNKQSLAIFFNSFFFCKKKVFVFWNVFNIFFFSKVIFNNFVVKKISSKWKMFSTM